MKAYICKIRIPSVRMKTPNGDIEIPFSKMLSLPDEIIGVMPIFSSKEAALSVCGGDEEAIEEIEVTDG